MGNKKQDVQWTKDYQGQTADDLIPMFKGTKGKWEFDIDEYHQQATIHSITVGNGEVCEVNYTDSNMSQVTYDFNLMAHSKEMLRMLCHVKDYLGSDQREKVEALIKSATEVDNGN